MTDLITSGDRLRGRVARASVVGWPATIDSAPGPLVRARLGRPRSAVPAERWHDPRSGHAALHVKLSSLTGCRRNQNRPLLDVRNQWRNKDFVKGVYLRCRRHRWRDAKGVEGVRLGEGDMSPSPQGVRSGEGAMPLPRKFLEIYS